MSEQFKMTLIPTNDIYSIAGFSFFENGGTLHYYNEILGVPTGSLSEKNTRALYNAMKAYYEGDLNE